MQVRLRLIIALMATSAQTAEVVGIVDGDTLDAIIDGQQQRVRLAQIDAPEKRQPYGVAAKQALSDLAFRRDCEIIAVDHDRYGRIIGQVNCAGTDVNRTLIATGYAWAYRQYVNDPGYLEAEAAAKEAKLGLWSETNPIPPWEFRKRRKE